MKSSFKVKLKGVQLDLKCNFGFILLSNQGRALPQASNVAAEAVEKVGQNAEERLAFGVSHNILANN